MDIKDLILIVGGLLIAAVIAHGLWTAWRARRDPLRLDLVADLPAADEHDDLRHLQGELPNGGSRVIDPGEVPRQEALALGEPAVDGARGGRHDPRVSPELDPSIGPEPAAESGARQRPPRTEPRLDLDPQPAATDPGLAAAEPDIREAQETALPGAEAALPGAEAAPQGAEQTAAAEPTRADPGELSRARDKVAEVIMPERSGRVEEPKEPRRWTRKAAADGAAESARRRTAEAQTQKSAARRRPEPRRGADAAGGGRGEQRAEAPVQELIMINLLAPKGSPFVGGALVESLRARGLRYGDMNIFHRQDPVTRSTCYSVANVVEPGTFDMTDLDNFRSPGVCFFMQLPGPEQPLEVFEDMLKVARDVAVRVGGELKDEQRSVMTAQTVEHYRQRISEFCRRRMSMRA